MLDVCFFIMKNMKHHVEISRAGTIREGVLIEIRSVAVSITKDEKLICVIWFSFFVCFCFCSNEISLLLLKMKKKNITDES